MAAKTAKKGDTVLVDYTGKLENGSIFDSSKGKQPIEFELGAGSVIKGFDAGLIGMKVGEKKDIKISPEEGYGKRNDAYIKDIPKKSIPESVELKEGTILMFKREDGFTMPATVTEIGKTIVKADFNHPLAGKKLIFSVTLVDIK
ncbi:MAG TPA: peptidylprolyl isomerase [Candidatus Nanoarchaeia archaeon]|nr:peptidylprolyl isomerase [Candidatus Nanoarchaeia archaeon]